MATGAHVDLTERHDGGSLTCVPVTGDERTRLRDRALEVLCDPALAHVVDLVAWGDGPAVVVGNARGTARLASGGLVEVLRGENPVAWTDPLAFTPLDAELADPSPPNARNAYPWPQERLASLFAAHAAPDLAVVHSGAHYWPEKGGHRGEHGSLSVVQSRAPLILSGAGVRAGGRLRRAARVVDVGPTLAVLAGVPPAVLAGLDGTPLLDLVDPAEPRHVVSLLWDGCNSNSLYALAEAGDLPHVASLMERGCTLEGGAIAEFPSVTLTNHTSALTGVGPGRHGIVNNAYFDRRSAAQVLTNNAATWHRFHEWLAPGVETVFARVEGSTACVNEPVDTGAGYSTFDLVRAGGSGGAASMESALPDPRRDVHATAELVASVEDYAWSTAVDAIGLAQVLELWDSPWQAPELMWWNTVLTDTGHHAGGAHSSEARAAMRDADARLGVFLEHLERCGALESTCILLTSDHGSEAADPACTGDWDEALSQAGVACRDEAYGFLYLGVTDETAPVR